MRNLALCSVIAFVGLASACSSSSSDSPAAQDAGSADSQTSDAAVADSAAMDASAMDSGTDAANAQAQWTLNVDSWVVGPLGPQCQDNGANGFTLSAATTTPTRSGIDLRLPSKPTADTTFTMTPPVPGPPPAGMAFVSVSVPNGTASEKHNAQSGTVTVTVVGGKVTATIGVTPSKGSIGMMTGTISGTVTCP